MKKTVMLLTMMFAMTLSMGIVAFAADSTTTEKETHSASITSCAASFHGGQEIANKIVLFERGSRKDFMESAEGQKIISELMLDILETKKSNARDLLAKGEMTQSDYASMVENIDNQIADIQTNGILDFWDQNGDWHRSIGR